MTTTVPADTVRPVLLYPPITDPTSPYHSLTYLDTYAREQGAAGATIIDANVEAFHYSYSPAGVARLTEALAHVAEHDYSALLSDDELQANLLRVGPPDPEAVQAAVHTLQDGSAFYDYERYQHAVNAVEQWMNCLGATGYPGQFRGGFQLGPIRSLLTGNSAILTDLTVLERLSRPFEGYYDDVLLPALVEGDYNVVGVNVTYLWQLPFALWLIHRIRQILPDAFVMVGGTEVADVWKYALDKTTAFTVFDETDAIVVGEGETAYVSILRARAAGELPVGHTNVRLHPRHGARRSLDLVHYEPLADVPTPDFSRIDWDRYLSPEPFVYYSPTRGCYWNKCTFCDYGLNTDGPTSPWRQSQADRMIEDVRVISRHARFIYFSVDVLAPATILRFAEKVVEEGLDIRWGAEIRLEKYWSYERCALLRRAGCIAVSVGFESGNQRVLDLIDKGTKPAQVEQTVRAMHQAGIAVQMMGFTGFPTETLEEATDSIDFLTEHRDLWTFGGLGEFALTSGAIVAKQPERFGLTNVAPGEGSDIPRTLRFDEPISQGAREEVAARKRAKLDNAHFDRPWLGGTDTPHTFFYHDRFATEVRAELNRHRRLGAADGGAAFVRNGEFVEHPGPKILQQYAALYGGGLKASAADKLLFRRADGTVLLLPRFTARLLACFQHPAPLSDAAEQLWLVDELGTARTWDFLIACGALRRISAPSDRRTPAVTHDRPELMRRPA